MPTLPPAIWQEIEIALIQQGDLLTVLVPEDHPGWLDAIVDGYLTVPALGLRSAPKRQRSIGRGLELSFDAALLSVSDRLGGSVSGAEEMRLYCRGLFRLRDQRRLALCLASKPHPHSFASHVGIRPTAVQLQAQFRASRAALEASSVAQDLEAALCHRSSEDAKESPAVPPHVEAYEQVRASLVKKMLTSVVAHLPKCLMVRVRTFEVETVRQAATRAIRSSHDPVDPPPRDGRYACLLSHGFSPREMYALVTWKPHRGPPAYSEIRAATTKRLPSAFAAPRRSSVDLPVWADSLSVPDGEVSDGLSFDPRNHDWRRAFMEVRHFNFVNRHGKAGNAIREFQLNGLDSLAWYQPHHVFSDATWGVYVHASRFDDAVCALSEELRREDFAQNDGLAATLLLGLLTEHQLFHAKFEAALTWAELNAARPRYLPYVHDVYAALRGTNACLGDALGTFWAWSWFSTDLSLAVASAAISLEEASTLTQIVERLLDSGPAGYRGWREGRNLYSWRTLATQALQGRRRVSSQGGGLPLETTLRETLPFDYSIADVPMRFVGRGEVASCFLQSGHTTS